MTNDEHLLLVSWIASPRLRTDDSIWVSFLLADIHTYKSLLPIFLAAMVRNLTSSLAAMIFCSYISYFFLGCLAPGFAPHEILDHTRPFRQDGLPFWSWSLNTCLQLIQWNIRSDLDVFFILIYSKISPFIFVMFFF